MAKRRCFSIDIFESDRYLSLSKQAQVLYFYLVLHADDEGVVSNPNYLVRLLRHTSDKLTELETKEFIIKIDDIYVIRHWHIHNKIAPSKRTPSVYQKQLAKLCLTSENIYELANM